MYSMLNEWTYFDLLSFSTISRKLTLLKSLQSKFSPNTVVMNNYKKIQNKKHYRMLCTLLLVRVHPEKKCMYVCMYVCMWIQYLKGI